MRAPDERQDSGSARSLPVQERRFRLTKIRSRTLTQRRRADRRIVIVAMRPDAINDTVTGLIALAAGGGQRRIEQALQLYRNNPAAKLLIAVIGHEPVGVVGYTEGESEVTLLHIATAEHVRRTGVGSRLLTEVRRSAPLGAPIVGETDNDALGFYAATGFVITSLGERYPGVERFHVRIDSPTSCAGHRGPER